MASDGSHPEFDEAFDRHQRADARFLPDRLRFAQELDIGGGEVIRAQRDDAARVDEALRVLAAHGVAVAHGVALATQLERRLLPLDGPAQTPPFR